MIKNRHRVFIAISLSGNIKKSLAKYQKQVEDLFDSDIAKWTKEDNLHIVLEFLGNISDQEVLEICEAINKIAVNREGFVINLNKITYGPLEKLPPKMIWAIGESSEELIALKNDLGKEFRTPEIIKYTPHVTLARVNKWAWQKMEPDERPNIEKDISVSLQVDSIDIVESVLKKSGPQYTILESIPLN